MNNIFDSAKFGDKFRTRDGRKAVYLKGDRLWIEGDSDWRQYYSKGNWFMSGEESKYDIVSEWKEEINEEELDRLADEYVDKCVAKSHIKSIPFEAFKAGYRQAWEEQK